MRSREPESREEEPDLSAPRFALFLVCFLLSGLAALVYQTTWSQELALAFGASQPAVAAVLAATMAGLAGGAALSGRLSERIRRPLRAYAWIECAVAAAALLVPLAVGGAGRLQRLILAGRPAEGAAATLFAFAATLFILFVPNALMGATLPLVTRRVVRAAAELGPRIAGLYAVNTLGAAVGATVSALILLPRLGLAATTGIAAGTSLLAGALAFGLDAAEPRRAAPIPEPSHAGETRRNAPLSWILPAILFSGAISFTYEVTWTRLLSHLLGGSIYAFGAMLAAFLVGIALGSGAASRLLRGSESARRAFAFAQLATAVTTLATYAAVQRLPAWLSATATGAAPLSGAALATAALLVPGAAAIGAAVPIAIRVLAREPAESALASARVLAWNTTGAILGAVASAFWLLPTGGFAGTMTLAVAGNVVLSAWAAAAQRPRLGAPLALAAVSALLLGVLPPSTPWTVLRSSPVNRLPVEGDATYLAVGRTATVLLLDTGAEWRLSTDGMPEAAIEPPGARLGQQPVNRWLSLLPLVGRPHARSMLVIGMGGGTTLEEIPSAIADVTVVEIEPEVVEANRKLSRERRRDPLADPRLQVVVNDARSFLRLTDRTFDVIVSQPSHPWTAGASHLFTREAFALARQRLAPGGVLVQWIGLNLVDSATLGSLVATLGAEFTYVEAFAPPPGTAMLFLASREPLGIDAASATAALESTPTWRTLGMASAEDLLIARLLDGPGALAFAKGAALNEDHHNLLAIRSPAFAARPLARSLDEIGRALGPFDPLPRTPGIDRFYAAVALLEREDSARALRVAMSIPQPVERDTAFALAAIARGDLRRGWSELLELASRHPEAAAPRRAWLRGALRRAAEGEPPGTLDSRFGIDPLSRAVSEGWRMLESGDDVGLARLESELAAIDSRDLLYPPATRLRIAWRLTRGDEPAAREAIALLDPLLASPGAPVRDILLRARLGLAARDADILRASLAEIAFAPGARQEAVFQSALDLLLRARAALPDAELSRLQRQLEARVRDAASIEAR